MACRHTWQLRGKIENGVGTVAVTCLACGELGTIHDVNQELAEMAAEGLDLQRRVKELEAERDHYIERYNGLSDISERTEHDLKKAERCVTARDKRIEELRTRYSQMLVMATRALGVIEACAPDASVRSGLDKITAEGCDFIATWREL